MAELADALDLGSSAARRAGSSPVPGTRLIFFVPQRYFTTWNGTLLVSVPLGVVTVT
jgi:hypothetical protein